MKRFFMYGLLLTINVMALFGMGRFQTYAMGTQPTEENGLPAIYVDKTSLSSYNAPFAIVNTFVNLTNQGTTPITWTLKEDVPGNLVQTPNVDVITDGGFEEGGVYWVQSQTGSGGAIFCDTTICSSDPGGSGPHGGNIWVRFGGSSYRFVVLTQTVIIPDGTANLNFYLQQAFCDPSPSQPEYFVVQIDETAVYTSDNTSPLCGTAQYTPISVNVSTFADGASHDLTFRSEVFGGSVTPTYFLLDDVSLDVTLIPTCHPGDITWLSVSPSSGSINAGASVPVTVTFSALNYPNSTVETGQLCLKSSDAISPVINLPVTMTVVVPATAGLDFSIMPTTTVELGFGNTVTYTLQVTNTGNIADDFRLDIINNDGWTPTKLNAHILLQPNETETLWIPVTVPISATHGQVSDTSIFLRSFQDTNVGGEAHLLTRALAPAVYSALLLPTDSYRTGESNTTLTHTLTLSNTGNRSDVYTLTVGFDNWSAYITEPGPSNPSLEQISLGEQESADFWVWIQIPFTTTVVLMDTAVVTATSSTNPTNHTISTLHTFSTVGLDNTVYLPVIIRKSP